MADQADQGFTPQPLKPHEQPKTPPLQSAEMPPMVPNADDALKQVSEAAEKVASTSKAPPNSSAVPTGLDMPEFEQSSHATTALNGGSQFNGTSSAGLDRLDDVELDVRIELGRTRMYVQDVLRLNADSVIELERAAGDPVDIRVNGQLVARGEVLVVDETLCVRIGEIVEEAHSNR
jgi:flagellar motor switch protein FliN